MSQRSVFGVRPEIRRMARISRTITNQDLATSTLLTRDFIWIVNIRVNPRVMRLLTQAGVPYLTRDRNENQKLIQKHTQEAERMGLNPYFLKRSDASGMRQADSGVQLKIASDDGLPVSIERLVWDFTHRLHMHLTDLHIMQKEGDDMGFLRMTYAVDGEEWHLTDGQKQVLEGVIKRCYQYCFRWVNPNGTGTINPSHVVEGMKVYRRLRLFPDLQAVLAKTKTPSRKYRIL